MGNKVMGKFRMNRYLGFQEDQINYLDDKWFLVNSNETLDTEKFAKNYNITVAEAKRFVSLMDVDKSGSVDFYKFKIGCSILCQSSPEETASFLFTVYDSDKDGLLGESDMQAFVRALLTNNNYFNEMPPPDQQEIDLKIKALLIKWDHDDKDGQLSQSEFLAMCKKDPEVVGLLYHMGFITKAELNLQDSYYNDVDSDLESEMERRDQPRDERIERIKDGIEHTVNCDADHEYGLEDENEKQKPEWMTQVQDKAPQGFQLKEGQNCPPNASLDLEYVYGYRCHDTRNNLRYDNKGRIAYHAAGVGISMDIMQMTQRHFIEHSDDISCMDVYDNRALTGQMGMHPLLIVWDLDTMRLLCIWKDQLLNGISHCTFSNDGSLIAAVSMDDDHSIAIYDIAKGIAYRKDPKNPDFGLVAMGKITKQDVFDIRFIPQDYAILLACMKEVSILTWRDGSLLAERCIWNDQKPQAALSIAFIDGFSVTGMFNGQLCVWKDNILEKSIKAHTQPVQAIWTRTNGRGIITGSKMGTIILWDGTLCKQSVLDIKDLAIAWQIPKSPMIISICESPDGRILIGTRQSEIVEITVDGERPKAKLLMQGHYHGELWGLSTHPSQQTFFTVGEDEMLAQWDAKNKRIIKSIDNEYAAKTCHVSQNAKFLAVGCLNGRIQIYEPNTLKRVAQIKEIIDPDKDTISIVKFSPNCELLAVAYCPPYNLIVFYSTKTWKSVKQVKGCQTRVLCMDFSGDGKYIQVNTFDNKMIFFDVSAGQQLYDGETILREEKWSTWTCVFGWSMQGVWPPCSNGSDINSCDRSKDGTVVVTGDDFGKVKLYNYPSVVPQSASNKYTGHSSYVCEVRFMCDGCTIISVGGDELSIFQWKFSNSVVKINIQVQETEQAEEQGNAMFEQAEIEQGDTIGAVKPFLGELKASIPSWYKPNKKRDNVLPTGNLSLYHVFGFRYFYVLDEARDMCAFTDRNTIAFAAAALGVETNPKTQEQSFFNKHEEDIVSFAMHPTRKICATGQMAQAGKAKQIDIFVWDVETKAQLANFREFHLRAIVLLKFSPDGTLLLSVGQDDDNSLAIHDWQANRLVATSNIDKSKVNAAAWSSQEEFVTCGNKHIKFWKISGRNVSGKMGAQSGTFQSQYSVSYAFKNSICVSGSGDGNLICWKGGSSGKGTPAHQGKVQSLYMDDVKSVLFSAGMDGKVVSWGYEGGSLVKKQEVVSMDKISIFPCGITALDYQPKTGTFLIGTCGAQIYTYESVSKRASLVLQGHYGEELWGACASANSHKFVSAGADKTVRIWDIDTRKMLIASKPFENDIRAIDWANNNKFIVCADVLGFLYLLDPNTLELKDTGASKFTKMPKRQSTYWIEDLKISPDCKSCAFGAHGAASHLEIWSIAYPKFGANKIINAGLTSALVHLDWSTDSSIAIVNSQAYEMKFVDINSSKNARSSACKDVEFASWTCKLGFPVQGVFPSADYSDVNSVVRSNSQKYLVSGEDTQKVVLFKYPVVEPKQLRKEYIGHSSHVTRVRFTFDDSFLISTGGLDKCIILWKTDFGGSVGKSKAEQDENGEEGDDDSCVAQEKTQRGKKKIAPPKKVEEAKDPDALFDNEDPGVGDQFMAVKPWMGAIKEPTQPYYNNKKLGHTPPDVELTIDYVYGYRSKDMRSNLWYLGSGQVLYNAAALGIVLDLESNTQTFFNLHEDDITAIDLSPADKMTVATGELGAKPSIYVWMADTKEVKCRFKGVLTKGVVCLNFTPSGKRLVGGAIDVEHQLAVFDVSGAGSVVWKDKGGPDVIIDIRCNDEDTFTTIGVKHFYVWVLNNGQIKKNKGIFGTKSCDKLSGISISGSDVVCGAADGSVQVWKGTNISKEFEKVHTLACDCITTTKDYLLSGGRDGKIMIYDKSYLKLAQVDCNVLLVGCICTGVRAICMHPTQQTMLIGTLGSDIYEVSYNTPKITDSTQFTVKKEAMHGHYSPNLRWTNEVWGLSPFNNDADKFATCSDDGTIRTWSVSDRRMISVGRTIYDAKGQTEKPNHATGDLDDQCKGRAVAVAPDDGGFVVGCKDGTMRIFDGNLKQTKVFKKAKEWISDIRFSPDGTALVHGSHDNAMYAQQWPSLKPLGKAPMKKHSSYITHFDFSCDGVNLHSTCGAYELLFWDVAQGKQLPGGASALKDEKWATWSVTLGWPVQGIWPECADGTDINSVDRSHETVDGKEYAKSYYLLASGDDFSQVRLLRYPSLKKASEAVVGRGHSSHVTTVKWNNNDTKLFSTGGEDQCVIQWNITKK